MMKATIGLIVFCLSFLTLASSAEAQVLNRLKDRAKNAAANKVEEKISNEVEKAAERAVEKSWNSIFGEGFGEPGDGISIPFTLNSNAVTEDSYRFDVITTMEIESIRKDGTAEEPMIMHMHFNEEELYTGTGFSGDQMKDVDDDAFLIYDMKNGSMVMLMETEDGKFSFAYDWKQAEQFLEEYSETDDDAEESDGEDYWQEFERIGTKSISGLECEGYRSENDGLRMEYWVTTDEGFGIYDMLRANSQTKQLRGKVPDEYPMGMLMEMVHEDVETGEKTTMRVTDINKNANVSFDMADYPAMSIGGGNQ